MTGSDRTPENPDANFHLICPKCSMPMALTRSEPDKQDLIFDLSIVRGADTRRLGPSKFFSRRADKRGMPHE